MSKTNYSFPTSGPAYHDKTHRQYQRTMLLNLLIRMGGKSSLLELANESNLPESTVSGRINDLIKDGLVYYGAPIAYKGRKRKQVLITLSGRQTIPEMRARAAHGTEGEQTELFNEGGKTYSI
jgi:DNA-binding MarR family transcriptional regulator